MLTVVAALIEKDGKFLIARRSTGDSATLGMWEFPGGKVEEGEDERIAIEREIMEEFEVRVQANKFLVNSVFSYPDRTIDLRLYECIYVDGEFHLHAHSEYRFVDKRELFNYCFAPADVALVEFLMKQ